MKKKLDISIIIPIYNAEKYLKRCVKSVLASLGDAPGEILLIDNNSTDSSTKIMVELESKHPETIRIFHCHARGASAARNLGMRHAKGKYIWFVDADDEISRDAIKLLLDEIRKTNADFVMIGANKILEDSKSTYLSAIGVEDAEFKNKFIRRAIGPWQIVFRKKWWADNGFAFREGIIHEDLELMPSLILYTDNIACVDRPLYNYYWTPGSVLHKDTWDFKYLDIFPALEGLHEKFRKMGALEKYHDDLEWFFIWNLLIDSAGDFKKGREGHIGYARTRMTLKKYFPNWRKNRILNQKKLGLKFRIRVYLSYLGIVI